MAENVSQKHLFPHLCPCGRGFECRRNQRNCAECHREANRKHHRALMDELRFWRKWAKDNYVPSETDACTRYTK